MKGHMNFKQSADHSINLFDWLESLNVYMSMVGQKNLEKMVNMLKHKTMVQ